MREDGDCHAQQNARAGKRLARFGHRETATLSDRNSWTGKRRHRDCTGWSLFSVGAFGVKHFRRSSVDRSLRMSLAGATLLFGIGAVGPPRMDYQEDAADQSGQRASRQTWRQHKPANGLASSIVPAGHRSADRRNPRFLLVRFYGSEVVVRSSMLRIIRVCLRHGCAFCSVALSRQCPVAAKRCARKAQGLTAQVRTEHDASGVPRCVPAHDSVPS